LQPSIQQEIAPLNPIFCIETIVTVKSLFHLGGRQATGFVSSIFELMGVELLVADHSTVSRRMGRLDITLPTLDATQARHVVVDSTYHQRSLSETAMFRQKNAFGGKVSSRKFDNQATELLCECVILNRMTHLAKPVSVPITP
jgi:Transposase DDE domain